MRGATVLAYMAAMLDGEGCVSMSLGGPKKQTIHFRIQVVNTNLDIMDWLVRHFGGAYHQKIRVKEGHKAAYCWQISRDAITWLPDVRPYMVIKGRQVDVWLAAAKAQAQKGKHNLSPDALTVRLGLVRDLTALNRKGVQNAA